ncbi:MAG: hypothetical protein ACLUIQ_03020 [Dialister invisus]
MNERIKVKVKQMLNRGAKGCFVSARHFFFPASLSYRFLPCGVHAR